MMIARSSLNCKRHIFLYLILTVVNLLSSQCFASDTGCPTEAILSLSEDILPREFVNECTSQELAETLLRRAKLSNGSVFVSGWQLGIFVPSNKLSFILKNGILNQHQIGSSSGALAQDVRRELEERVIGIKLRDENNPTYKSKTDFILPKYGIAFPVSHNARSPLKIFPELLGNYGDALIVLKPSIYNRTTVSFGDSYNQNKYNPKGIVRKGNPCRIRRVSDESDFPDQTTRPRFCTVEYIETQTWGEISPSDIEEIRMSKKSEISDELCREGMRVFLFEKTPWFLGVPTLSSEYEMPVVSLNLRRGISICD